MQLDLTEDEIKFMLSVLGQLPTSSNAWPLVRKIEQQAVEQQQEKPNVE